MELACEPGCDDYISCDSGACDSGGGCGGGCPIGGLLGKFKGGSDEPFELFGSCGNLSMGGWIQMGYHDENNTLFNNRADEYNLHQAWLFAEKAIDTSNGFDIGGRIDYMYGIDSNDTQAFGTDPRGWDNDWDNGVGDAYGHALPQAYFEAGYGDLSVKIGHFYTIIGWEVVTAPDNFFYSHAYTMYNSEPFTHTGALGTYTPSEDVTVWGGYTLGWDSGFDDNGDNFLGGLSYALCDDLTLTYATTIGRFGALPLGSPEKGYMHSIVADVTLTDKLQYIFQSDLLDTEDNNNNTARETFGINQYLIYSVNDRVSLGGRFEWYNEEGVYSAVGQDSDIYALTIGANFKPCGNVIVRPEYRWDWDDDQVVGLADGDEQQTFGIDTIFLF
tara:strand:+ start:7809 stop:8972 length:1164 start_codon:yes stop_codon:yes gene_type:complete